MATRSVSTALYGAKTPLKHLAARRLPGEVISHRKEGSESAMVARLRTDLAEYARDILSNNTLGTNNLFDDSNVTARHHVLTCPTSIVALSQRFPTPAKPTLLEVGQVQT